MKGKLTRRKFIGTTIKAGSTLIVFPGFQVDCFGFADCDNCQIHGKTLASAESFNLLKKRFCPNCGIDLYFNKYPVCNKSDCSADVIDGVKNTEKQHGPLCCQVPFPDKTLAGSTNKPVFRVADLQF